MNVDSQIIAQTKPPFRILTIDGGGFKGLYTANLLTVLHEYYGGSILDGFDMICGTSTGGLIALALSIGMTPKEIVQFYKEWGPRIFQRPSGLVGLLDKLQSFRRKSKYAGDTLLQATTSIFKDKRMDDALIHLCVPAFDVTVARPRVFKTTHDRTLTRDSRILMREIAASTASAPVFFPIASCTEPQGPAYYIDGGIWANNPALVGLTEACRFFVGEGKKYGSVRILALGNVQPPPGRLASDMYPDSPMDFAKELVSACMEAQQQSVDYLINFVKESFSFDVEYIRIPPLPLSPNQSSGIDLDKCDKKAVETLAALGTARGHEFKSNPRIEAFFRGRSGHGVRG